MTGKRGTSLPSITRTAPLSVQTWNFPARLALLVFGLFLYGLALRMMLDARVGLAPWEAFHQGVTRVLPLSIGVVNILISALIMLLTALALRMRPGLGTLLNVIGVGAFQDVLGPLVPDPSTLLGQWGQFLLGLLLLGLATAGGVSGKLP